MKDKRNEIIFRMAEEIRDLRARVFRASEELKRADLGEERMLTSIANIEKEYGIDTDEAGALLDSKAGR